MSTVMHRFAPQTSARPSMTNVFLAIASTLLCLNLRESLAEQATADQNADASYSWGM